MWRLCVVREGSQSHAGPDVDPFPLIAREVSIAQRIPESFRDHHCRIFPSLWQQHNKFVSAVTKRKVNQSKLGLDQVPDLGEQAASHQMSLGIVDLFEVIEVNKDDAE